MLKRLEEKDIEMVRHWRNSALVSSYMEKREHITPAQQAQWFKSIDNINNNYFLILDNHNPVGLVYGAFINWAKGVTGNGGIFMADENYFHTGFPLRASLLLTDVGVLMGQRKNHIRILRDNARAIFFNRKLGYRLLPGQEMEYNQAYALDAENYLVATKYIKKALGFGERAKISLYLNGTRHDIRENAVYWYNLYNDPDTSPLTIFFGDEHE